MNKFVYMIMVCLLLAVFPVVAAAQEDVQSMIDALPSVEDFQAMDADRQLEVYNQTQTAYDAYMALTEEEKAEIAGAEETFEALFGHFNSLVMPLEPAVEEPRPMAKDRNQTLLAGAATLAVVILLLRFLNKKK